MMTLPTENQKALGAALGRLASGVHIITADNGQTTGGMIASWVMQAGFEPAAITMAMAPDRHVASIIQQSGRCVINMLPEGNYGLMKPFGKGSEEPFSQLATRPSQYGVVLADAAAYLEVVVVDTVVGKTDHTIYVAHVVGGAVLNDAVKPMTHTRTNGFQY